MKLPAYLSGLTDEKHRPHVLQLLPALGDGGVERSTVEMAEFLAAKGIANWIASKGGDLVAQVDALGTVHWKISVGDKSPLAILRNAFAVARLIDANEIDIVHARSRAPAWVGWLATLMARRPCRFLTTFHGVYGHGNAFKRAYNRVMLRSPIVVANSEFIRHHIETVYGVESERIIVAPRGIDPKVFDPSAISAERAATIRDEFGVGTGVPLLVMVGRITGWKGHGVLLKALAHLADQPWHLVLVGSGKDGLIAEAKDLSQSLGLFQRVSFAGSRRDVAAILATADLAFSASTEPEAFGRAAIEAQAMETPVIATDHGGSRETVVPGKTGWLVRPGDAADMAKAVRDALSDPERLLEMGKAGRMHVMAHFTKQHMLEQEYAAYERLLAIGEARGDG